MKRADPADSGIFVFKLHDCKLSRSEAQVEILMDDNLYPAYVSPKIKSSSSNIEDSRFCRHVEKLWLT